MTRFDVHFTARKRDPVSKDRYRWTHGPYDLADAEAHAAKMREHYSAAVRVEVVAQRSGKKPPRGRPKRGVDLNQAREHLAKGRSVRETAARMNVPRATLQRALDRPGGPKMPANAPAPPACGGLPRIWCGTSETAPLVWGPENLIDCASERRNVVSLTRAR